MAELDPQLVQILTQAQQNGSIGYTTINTIHRKYASNKEQIGLFLGEIERLGIQKVDDTPSYKPVEPRTSTETFRVPKGFTDQGTKTPPFEFPPKTQGTPAEDEFEDSTVAEVSIAKREAYFNTLNLRMRVIRKTILEFYELLRDEENGKVKIDENALERNARLATAWSKSLIARFNLYLEKMNRKVYAGIEVKVDVGIDPLDEMEVHSYCLKYAHLYPNYKNLADSKDQAYIEFRPPTTQPPTSESINMDIWPIYRAVVGLNEDANGYCYTTCKWRGVICEGDEMALIELSGSKAIAAREISSYFAPILLENMPFKPANPPKNIESPITTEINDKVILSDLEGKIQRGTRVTKCVVCGGNTNIGSDYCCRKCREYDEDNIDDHHINYVHYN